jgi:uncharacterized protein (TIGR02444 family)
MTAADAAAFWRFSLRFYDQPDVRDTCLKLQDEAGLNVNLVLWCCWQAARGRALAKEDVASAAGRISEWSGSVTQPLRKLRRQVKAGREENLAPEARDRLYERLKAAELEAERVEQALLCRKSAPGTETTRSTLPHLVKVNLGAYMQIADAPRNGLYRTVIPEKLAHRLASLGRSAEFGGF